MKNTIKKFVAIVASSALFASMAITGVSAQSNEFVGVGGFYDIGTATTDLDESGGVLAGDTTITVTSAAGISAGDYILVTSTDTDAELMYVVSIATNDLTVNRGANGTTASAHSDADSVYVVASTGTTFSASFKADTAVAAGGTVILDVPLGVTVDGTNLTGDVDAVAASADSATANTVTVTADVAGAAGNAADFDVIDDAGNTIDCSTAVIADDTDGTYSLTCDLDGSGGGSAITTAILLAALNSAGSGAEGVLSGTQLGTGAGTPGAETFDLTGGADAITEDDVDITSDNATPITENGVEVLYDSGNNEARIIVTFANAIAIDDVVTIEVNNSRITLPATDSNQGQYMFALATTDSNGVVQDTGYALVNASNEVSVTAVVLEALIMTIDDTTLNLVVDPSVNDGVDQTQKTELTVKTNALTYNIQAMLNNAMNNDNGLHYNDGTNDNYISNAFTGENVFGYKAYDPDVVATAGEADAAFSTTPANIFGTAEDGMTNSETSTVYYDLDVDYTIPAGDYTGTITYTAVPTF